MRRVAQICSVAGSVLRCATRVTRGTGGSTRLGLVPLTISSIRVQPLKVRQMSTWPGLVDVNYRGQSYEERVEAFNERTDPTEEESAAFLSVLEPNEREVFCGYGDEVVDVKDFTRINPKRKGIEGNVVNEFDTVVRFTEGSGEKIAGSGDLSPEEKEMAFRVRDWILHLVSLYQGVPKNPFTPDWRTVVNAIYKLRLVLIMTESGRFDTGVFGKLDSGNQEYMLRLVARAPEKYGKKPNRRVIGANNLLLRFLKEVERRHPEMDKGVIQARKALDEDNMMRILSQETPVLLRLDGLLRAAEGAATQGNVNKLCALLKEARRVAKQTDGRELLETKQAWNFVEKMTRLVKALNPERGAVEEAKLGVALRQTYDNGPY